MITTLLSGIPATLASNVQAVEQLHDIKDVLPVAQAWPWWAWAAVAGTALAVGLACLFLVRARRNRQKQKEPPALPPDQAALAGLEQCRELARQGDGRQFAIRLADVLRRYIESRFKVNAQALTTREFFSHVTGRQGVLSSLPSDHADLLTTLLNHCDMAKFACAQPGSEEMEAMADQAISFVRATSDDTEQRDETEKVERTEK